MRKLIDNTEVEELDKAKTLKVHTKCPEKWLLIDMETGQHYRGFSTDGHWDWNPQTRQTNA
jgi:hypothetical protein